MAQNQRARVALPQNAALYLRDTDAGKAWLSQFEADHQPLAAHLLGALTLVSHNAFERALTRAILRQAELVNGPVGLFATRETNPAVDFFEANEDPNDPFKPLDAVGRGADLGSEARVAALIRNLCKTQSDKLFNHPSRAIMRKERIRAILVVDDFIGSGKRTAEFITAIWHSKTVRSWHSRNQIRLVAVAYSGTEIGLATLAKLRCKPTVSIERDCPSLLNIPWSENLREKIISVCDAYGRKTSRKGMRLGFKRTMAAIVFEHGCPNNAPAILWAPKEDKAWEPIFPDRTVLLEQASAFPPDITARIPTEVLTDLQHGREGGGNSTTPIVPASQPLGINAITALAMATKGACSRAAISYATGLPMAECTDLLNRLVKLGFVTATLRPTPAGRTELASAMRIKSDVYRLPSIGSDCYHPQQLRRPRDG